MTDPTPEEIAQRIVAAGWNRTQSGRFYHDAFPGPNGRRRLFTADEVIAQTAEQLRREGAPS